MTRSLRPPADPAPSAVPPGALAVAADHGVAPGELRPLGKLGLRRPVTRLGGRGIVVEIAEDDEGRARIRRELWGRSWAASAGVPTAVIHGSDPDGGWLVGEWVPAAPTGGQRYLDRAVQAALAVGSAVPPLPGPGAAVWRSPRRAAVLRTARAISGRMPMRLWWAARTAARDLPQVPVAHGDFYHRNVLWRADRDEVCVIDWEYLGAGPRHGDLLRMWTILPDRRDRDSLLDRLLSATPPAQHREIAALGLWLALRLLGENIKSPRTDRNAADLAHARSIQPEARDLARTHDAWPL
jgi:hypothetical protein